MATKKLTRSSENKVIGGICGGLGEYFDIDPVIFRLIFIVLLLCAGGGGLLYLIMLFVIPMDNKTTNNPSDDKRPNYNKAADSDTSFEEVKPEDTAK
ncbi:MAG: PspC domain-containing protein [Bacteroidales bacterium]|nr:PspC domain-containing protein [Bacteroidales bacterium]